MDRDPFRVSPLAAEKDSPWASEVLASSPAGLGTVARIVGARKGRLRAAAAAPQ